MKSYNVVIDRQKKDIFFKIFVLFLVIFSSIVHAKGIRIPSKIVLLAKKKIYNKNIRFYWDESKKQIDVKRNYKHMQYVNFGVKPSTAKIIDVNFDGYGDMVLTIPENIEGDYDKDGPREHNFYYLYDKKQKKFQFHKKLTTIIYEADVYGMQAKGYAFDAKKKVLHTFDMEEFWYGGNAYIFKGRNLILKKKGFRLVPENYPDGVDTEYTYKNDKLSSINAKSDTKPRKSVKIKLTSPNTFNYADNIKLPEVNSTLEKMLVNDLHALFENHQIETFNQTHFLHRNEMHKNSDLMNVVMMLDTLFKIDGKREKEDTLFELIEKFSNIKKLSIDKFNYDVERGFYEMDVRIHFKGRVEKYQWHFFRQGDGDYFRKSIDFLPIAYDKKRENNILLNENFQFDYMIHGHRVGDTEKGMRISTLWEYEKGKKGWFSSTRDCSEKYIEFRLYDFTGDGNVEWLVSCRDKLKRQRSSEYQIRYGGKFLFNAMTTSNASTYLWHEKLRRFVFIYRGTPRESYKIFRLARNLDDNSSYFKKGIHDEYWQVDNKGESAKYVTTYGDKIYTDKVRFEKSFTEDNIYAKEDRPRVLQGTRLYSDIDDIKKNKASFVLDEDTPVIPINDEESVKYWDKNISKTKPALELMNVIYKERVYWMDHTKLKKEGTK